MANNQWRLIRNQNVEQQGVGSPMEYEKIPRPRKEKYLPTVLSQDQIKHLIEHDPCLSIGFL